VESAPIPTRVAFELWQPKAKQFCDNTTQDDMRLTQHDPSQCKDRVDKKHPGCATKLASNFPEVLTTKSDTKDLGRQYMACVLPKPVCNGVEIDTEEDIQKHCR
jgi:hypothetical protein